MKLLLRKPTTPSGHILAKSRKDLHIGDAWKKSYFPEGYGGTKKWKKGQNKMKKAGVALHKKDRYSGYVENVEVDEGVVLDVGDVDKWMKEIEKGIDAPWIQVRKSVLVGDENLTLIHI